MVRGCPTHSRVSNEWETIDQLEATSLRLVVRQFTPTHSNLRNEWGTRHQSRYRKLVRAVMKDTGGWFIGTDSRVSNPARPGAPGTRQPFQIHARTCLG